MNGTRVSINGIDLYHEVHGTGRPLVVLHGGVMNAETCFGAMLPRLTKGHQVIAVDLQGHGHTAATDRPLSLANFAADVVGLLDHLSIERADLFGFSLGSLVSTEMAVTYPTRVGRLVLASGHIRSDGYHPEILAPEQTSPLLPTEADFEAMQAAYAAVAPDPDQFFPFLERMQPVVSAFEGWSDAAIGGIEGPTLIIVGDRDFVRLEHAAADARALSRCPTRGVARDDAHAGDSTHRRLARARRALPRPENLNRRFVLIRDGTDVTRQIAPSFDRHER